MDSLIITGANNSSTTDMANASTISRLVDLQLLDASMETAAFVATMEEVAAMVGELVLYAVLPGTRPSSALRQVKASMPLPKEIVI